MLSNARCLSEGVDVPTLDGVAFIDPRSSQVDIIQAVGRAIRLSPDKKAGTIVLPVFIAAGQDAEDTIEASNFKPVWNVLNALKAHDDVLAAELDQIRTELGRKPGTGVSAEGLRKIFIDLPTTVHASFGSALRTYLVEQVTSSWNFGFGSLEAFVEREGHAKVPWDFKLTDGYRLGQWVTVQRRTIGNISQERKALLEALPGWSWDLFSDQWEEGFRYLKEFTDREGHANVTQNCKSADGYPVGQWVSVQRRNRDDMPPEHKARLEVLSGWVWDVIAEQWEEGFRYLKEFTDREGHAKVSSDYKTADGYRLGQWVSERRKKQDNLSPERKVRLETLPGWSWKLLSDQWEEGFIYLKEFADREGNTLVPHRYKSADGYRLGQWVSIQRKRKVDMRPERKVRLEALSGWSWDAVSANWEEGYRYLKEFAELEGHCLVTSLYRTDDGYPLGQWVSVQRKKKDDMPPDRKARLEAISGWAWDAMSEKWEKGYRYLKEFTEREGHAVVPQHHKMADGYPLGQWVGVQRFKQNKLSLERRIRLEALHGWVW